MTVGLRRRHSAARRPLQESLLNEKRLVHFLERIRVLANGYGDRVQSHRTTVELLDDRLEHARIHVVEAEFIHIQHRQRLTRDR